MTLRVLAFTPLPEAGAAGRYRVFQFIEPLRAHGIVLDVQPFFDEPAFARLYTRASAATITGGPSEGQRNVIAQRGLGLPRS